MLAKYGFECPEPTDGTQNFLLQTSGISSGEITLPSQSILQMHLCKKYALTQNMYVYTVFFARPRHASR